MMAEEQIDVAAEEVEAAQAGVLPRIEQDDDLALDDGDGDAWEDG